MRGADGTRLAWTRTGPSDGRRVVLCDGISCDGHIYRLIRPRLERRCSVLHVHYRGHGRSGLPRDPDRSSIPDLARDLDAALAHVGWSNATFFGHSMGVQVVLETALRFPSRVTAGVLACGSHGRLLDSFGRTDLGARIFPAIDVLFRRYREEIATATRAFMPTPLAYLVASLEVKADRIKPEDFQPYLDHFARMPIDLFLALLQDAGERTALPWLHHLPQPFLVVAGEDDGFTPLETSELLARRLPDARFVTLPDTSHTAPLENPEAFAEAVEAFLADTAEREPRDLSGPGPGWPAARWPRTP
jgi:pimeloyl-ACP methyl ester carboxylesterase